MYVIMTTLTLTIVFSSCHVSNNHNNNYNKYFQHMSDLLTSIDAYEIPLELGGECTSLLSESNEEKQLRELVASRLRDDGCISGSKFPDGSLEIEQPIRSNQYNSSDNVYEDDVKIEDIEYQVLCTQASFDHEVEENEQMTMQ